MELSETELASAYSLLLLRMDDRANEENMADYFEKVYSLDIDEFEGLFKYMTDNEQYLDQEMAFLLCLTMYELGRCHEEYKRDLNSLGE